MIVQQLLHFGRAHDSRQRVIAPTTLIRDAVAAVQEEARRVHCRVRITAPHSEAQLRVDPVRLHMALANLLRNAVQVSPGGEVKVSFALLNMGVVFIVEDQGPGVPENLRRQIFEPFFTTKDVGQGSGLGLAVVHSVAREHGGSAYVASRDRTGARFVIELPAQALARPAAQTG
jgi:signal transduction histidine kinase